MDIERRCDVLGGKKQLVELGGRQRFGLGHQVAHGCRQAVHLLIEQREAGNLDAAQQHQDEHRHRRGELGDQATTAVRRQPAQ